MSSLAVIYDACVLFPPSLRDLLMRIAVDGLVRARWTDQILDEVFRSILRARSGVDEERLRRTRSLMCAAVPDCMISGYEHLIDGLQLPDLDDRHVLAAAMHAGAKVIVTHNTKDFPPAALAPYGIVAQHPDDFLLDLLARAEGAVLRIIEVQASDLRNPPRTVEDLLGTLARNGLARSTARIRTRLGLD